MSNTIDPNINRAGTSGYIRATEQTQTGAIPDRAKTGEAQETAQPEKISPSNANEIRSYIDKAQADVEKIRYPQLPDLGKMKINQDNTNDELEKARQEEEAKKAKEEEEIKQTEKQKLFDELKALEEKIQDTMNKYSESLKGDDPKASEALLQQFNNLMNDRQALLEKLGIGGLDTSQQTPIETENKYTPIYSGGRGPNNGWFDGYPATIGEQIPTPSMPAPVGQITPNGTGQDAVNLAKQYLGYNSIDCKGKLPNFTAAGGQTNNCADFVSACLESTGRIKGHHINVVELEKSLIAQGYKRVPKEQAKPGDVWISSSRGHTELVAEAGGKRLIGSNNDRPGHQVISMNNAGSGYYYQLGK